MTTHIQLHPCAKVNLGLNIVGIRQDGYHDIETVFYPIPLCDELTVALQSSSDAGMPACHLTMEGRPIEGKTSDNLVVRAYHLLADDMPLPPVHVTLRKEIPTQAGLGGGSSDAAAMLNALNSLFDLHLSHETLQCYAARLGADCAFFITSEPAFATGIGDVLTPISLTLSGWHLLLVKPDDAVSTREAYAGVSSVHPAVCCRDAVARPVEEWHACLRNDFELSVLPQHPRIADVRRRMKQLHANYIQLSGSGSTMFALSRRSLSEAHDLCHLFGDCWWRELVL